jgi:hypothetical protein
MSKHAEHQLEQEDGAEHIPDKDVSRVLPGPYSPRKQESEPVSCMDGEVPVLVRTPKHGCESGLSGRNQYQHF